MSYIATRNLEKIRLIELVKYEWHKAPIKYTNKLYTKKLIKN